MKRVGRDAPGLSIIQSIPVAASFGPILFRFFLVFWALTMPAWTTPWLRRG
jgi:hypothetical protein